MATLAPISAQPRAASIPIPLGPEAPVTTTTLPLREKRSMRDSALGIPIGMLAVCVSELRCVRKRCSTKGCKSGRKKR